MENGISPRGSQSPQVPNIVSVTKYRADLALQWGVHVVF